MHSPIWAWSCHSGETGTLSGTLSSGTLIPCTVHTSLCIAESDIKLPGWVLPSQQLREWASVRNTIMGQRQDSHLAPSFVNTTTTYLWIPEYRDGGASTYAALVRKFCDWGVTLWQWRTGTCRHWAWHFRPFCHWPLLFKNTGTSSPWRRFSADDSIATEEA